MHVGIMLVGLIRVAQTHQGKVHSVFLAFVIAQLMM
jgi:hypothetical protein